MKNNILEKPQSIFKKEYVLTYSKLGNIAHLMFILSIFLYPFVFANHNLYVIPQIVMLAITGANLKKRIYLQDYFAFFCGIIAFIIPLMVEFTADEPNYELAAKLFVNVVSIIVVAGDDRIKFSPKTLRQLRYVCCIWIVIALALYVKGGVTSLASVLATFNSDSDINGSSLYYFAEPLTSTFLTKNIAGMFVVSVFALYCYVAYRLNKLVTALEFAFFFFAAACFLSRQVIMSMIVLYGVYRTLIAGFMGRTMVVSLSVAAGVLFFSRFFDISNTNDGANQRLELWIYFFHHYQEWWFLGNGVEKLNTILWGNVGIDNFHMFFMNQIGAYGIIHFIAFSLFLIFIFKRVGEKKPRIVLVVGYLLNVCFQTYGYEYGNLFLFLAMFIAIDPRPHKSVFALPKIKLH